MGLLNDPHLESLLDRLHGQSAAQNDAIESYFTRRAREGTLDSREFDDETHRFMSDKFIALDRDKSELCYQLCRAVRAKRVVEAGTSFGVSTLYLAAAVRDNIQRDGGTGVVIGTEHEREKVRVARAHFAEAGLADVIDLREGDLRETLSGVGGRVDFLLLDIWVPMARPALELVFPALRPGAIVIADNTEQFREAYHEYFEFVNAREHGLRTMTLPFPGGLELTVRD
jgi:predicted O-methyltransferase YrrM